LVLGDTGVGKTSLVHLLCSGKVLTNPSWTVGCNFEVLLHQYRGQNYFVEFWDVAGGSRYFQSRSVCYENVNGVLLVHDLSNNKSYSNLKRWIAEVSQAKENPSSRIQEYASMSLNGVPVLVVGNKYETVRKKPLEFDDEMGLEEINISAHDPGTFATGSHPSTVVAEFLDKIISTQTHQNPAHSAPARTTLPAYSQNLSVKPPRTPRIQEDVIRSYVNTAENVKTS